MATIDQLTTRAKRILTPQTVAGTDLWLWEHSERVMRLGLELSQMPEIAERNPNQLALAGAALFHNAGWVAQLETGQLPPWQLFHRPTNDVQREVAAGLLEEHLADVLAAEDLSLAATTIRQCADRYTELVEAMVLADAESLADTGLLYIFRQFRQYQAEGRPLDQLIKNWQRQKEYRYWEARINDGLRFECSRAVALRRLQPVDGLMDALVRNVEAADVRAANNGQSLA